MLDQRRLLPDLLERQVLRFHRLLPFRYDLYSRPSMHNESNDVCCPSGTSGWKGYSTVCCPSGQSESNGACVCPAGQQKSSSDSTKCVHLREWHVILHIQVLPDRLQRGLR